MDYFVTNLPIICIAALIVAGSAVLYWYSLERSARAKRQRAEARKAEALRKRQEENDSNQ